MLVKNESGGRNHSQLPSPSVWSSAPGSLSPSMFILNPHPASQTQDLPAGAHPRCPEGLPPRDAFRLNQ